MYLLSEVPLTRLSDPLLHCPFDAVFFYASWILRYAIIENNKGRTHVWGGSLSRYVPRDMPRNDFVRQTVTDYFAPRGHSAFEKF